MRIRTICNVCEGEGYLPDSDDDGEDIDVGSAVRCEECGGSGFADESDGIANTQRDAT